jgi:hypothetical protein
MIVMWPLETIRQLYEKSAVCAGTVLFPAQETRSHFDMGIFALFREGGLLSFFK